MRKWTAPAAILVLGLLGSDAAAREKLPPTAICKGITCLDQGWAEHERAWWYAVSQGSRLLPLRWFLELEAAGSRDKLASDASMARFGYLPNPKSPDNPYGLPVGFAVDKVEGGFSEAMCETLGVLCESPQKSQPWVGMNCAACHTGQISYKGQSVRIEGAPTLADFQTFTESLLEALKDTAEDEDKFARFASAIGETNDRPLLRRLLGEVVGWQSKLQEKNHTSLRYGFGRLDAQGHILNKVSLVLGVDDQLATFPADAPVSYPQIWNAPQHDRVQWNGIAQNRFKFTIFGREHDIGALIRNTSEVVGVFADIEISKTTDKLGYSSSLRLSNMIEIERQLGRLQSPKWPEEVLGPLDWERVERGQRLFVGLKCVNCHSHLEPSNTKKPIKAEMLPLDDAGTDIWTACNTFLHESKSGAMEGRKTLVFTGDRIQAVDRTRQMLANASVGSIIGRADELIGQLVEDAFVGLGEELGLPPPVGAETYLPGIDDELKIERARSCLNASSEILAYKARPLNGIWATAPYLHNGSVPTLYDLLLPSRMRTRIPPLAGEASSSARGAVRPERFQVGSREFDPVKVGYVTEPRPGGFVFDSRDGAGTPILGNYNSGHEGPAYGQDTLTDEERLDLVEYLKSL